MAATLSYILRLKVVRMLLQMKVVVEWGYVIWSLIGMKWRHLVVWWCGLTLLVMFRLFVGWITSCSVNLFFFILLLLRGVEHQLLLWWRCSITISQILGLVALEWLCLVVLPTLILWLSLLVVHHNHFSMVGVGVLVVEVPLLMVVLLHMSFSLAALIIIPTLLSLNLFLRALMIYRVCKIILNIWLPPVLTSIISVIELLLIIILVIVFVRRPVVLILIAVVGVFRVPRALTLVLILVWLVVGLSLLMVSVFLLRFSIIHLCFINNSSYLISTERKKYLYLDIHLPGLIITIN